MTLDIPNMGKVTASKSTLCYLATLFSRLDSYASAEGKEDLASLRFKQFNTIYEALDETGFFDNVKE